MHIIVAICWGVLGVLLGSFLNVVVLRHRTGKSIHGRSRCSHCRVTLPWYTLIPVLSYVWLRGRCHACLSRIHWQYPLGELILGILFFWLGYHVVFFSILGVMTWLPVALYGFIFFLGLAISIYDIRHHMIPMLWNLMILILSFGSLFLSSSVLSFTHDLPLSFPGLWEVLAGPMIALPFFLIWCLSKGKYIGFADLLLMISVGWLLGLLGGIGAVILAFWTALLFIVGISLFFSVSSLVSGKKRSILSSGMEIPFAPFLFIGWFLIISLPTAWLLKIFPWIKLF